MLMLFDYSRVLDKREFVNDNQKLEATRAEIAEKNDRLKFLMEHGELTDLTATTIRKLGDEIKDRRRRLFELETAARFAESRDSQNHRGGIHPARWSFAR